MYCTHISDIFYYIFRRRTITATGGASCDPSEEGAHDRTD